jgi:hypothetical protein
MCDFCCWGFEIGAGIVIEKGVYLFMHLFIDTAYSWSGAMIYLNIEFKTVWKEAVR